MQADRVPILAEIVGTKTNFEASPRAAHCHKPLRGDFRSRQMGKIDQGSWCFGFPVICLADRYPTWASTGKDCRHAMCCTLMASIVGDRLPVSCLVESSGGNSFAKACPRA